MTEDIFRHDIAPDGTSDCDATEAARSTSAHLQSLGAEPWLDCKTDSRDAPCPAAGRTLVDGTDALAVLLRLVGRERDGAPALWFLVLDAWDRILPIVVPVAAVPTVPDREVAAHLVHVLASILEGDAPGGSVVVAYVRPGGGDRGAFEAGWSSALHASADREEVRIRVEAAIGCDRARVLPVQWRSCRVCAPPPHARPACKTRVHHLRTRHLHTALEHCGRLDR